MSHNPVQEEGNIVFHIFQLSPFRRPNISYCMKNPSSQKAGYLLIAVGQYSKIVHTYTINALYATPVHLCCWSKTADNALQWALFHLYVEMMTDDCNAKITAHIYSRQLWIADIVVCDLNITIMTDRGTYSCWLTETTMAFFCLIGINVKRLLQAHAVAGIIYFQINY